MGVGRVENSVVWGERGLFYFGYDEFEVFRDILG